MSTNTPPDPEPTTRDAFTLLSKPTLDLTDAEIEVIVKDLRARRERFLAGQKDNAPKPAKAKAEPMSAEAKKAAADDILASIGNLL